MSAPAITNPRLEDLWCLEAVGINDPLSVNDDDEALEDIKFEDGRYQVTWLWKSENIYLPDNYFPAYTRMRMLINHLQSDKAVVQGRRKRGSWGSVSLPTFYCCH